MTLKDKVLKQAKNELSRIWQIQLQVAKAKPWLASLLLKRMRRFWQRVLEIYQQLKRLPRAWQRRLMRGVAGGLLGTALMLASGLPVLAGTITVDNTTCTLIDAITTANTDTNTGGCTISGTVGGADTIELPANSTINLTEVNSSYLGDNGLPVISSTITIAGNGAIIQRSDVAPSFRIMSVNSSGNLTLNDVTLSNGKTSGSSDGGAVWNGGTMLISRSIISGNATSGFGAGGGVYSRGNITTATLTINNSTISNNSATGTFGRGGGVYNRAASAPAVLTINNSTISGNSVNNSRARGGGVFNRAINAAATVTLNNSTISGNSADGIFGRGGGVYNYAEYGPATVTLNNSTITDNSAKDGGGVYNVAYEGSDVATLILNNSTISGNKATDDGGGVYNYAYYGPTSLIFNNSTISGNRANDNGGGIFNYGYDAPAPVTLNNSTISGNSANDRGGGVYIYGYNVPSTLTLNGSLVSGNQAGGGKEIFKHSSTTTVIVANNYNLLGHSGLTNAQAFANFTPTTSTDITATSDGSTPTALTSILDPTLQNNGGDTATHNLVSSSPAIDALSSGPSTDQRGVTRPVGTAFDIGAVEFDDEAPDISAVTLVSPIGTINNTRPTFTWVPASDSGGGVSYTLLLTDSHGITTTVTTTETSYTPSTDLVEGDYTWTIKAQDIANSDSDYVAPVANFTLTTISQVYLPLIFVDSVQLPDLIITDIQATANDDVIVTIKNNGTATVTDAFWVDVYFNQTPALNTAGQVWWGLSGANGGIPIAPGAEVTLSLSSPYWAGGSAPTSADIMVQGLVDSFGPFSFGNVQEANEDNNISGVINVTGASDQNRSDHAGNGSDFDSTELPSR